MFLVSMAESTNDVSMLIFACRGRGDYPGTKLKTQRMLILICVFYGNMEKLSKSFENQ